MPYCHHCGSMQEADAAVCTQCGAPQTDIAPDAPSEQIAAAQADPAAPVSLEKSEPAAAQPMKSVTPGTSASSEKTFSERYFAPLMAGGIVGILALLALILLLFLPSKQAKWETPIFQAFEDTHAALMKELSQASDEIGLTPVLKDFAKKGATQELTLSVPIPDMGAVEIYALQAQNAKGNQAYGLMNASFMGFKLSLLEYSLERNFMAFASPFLFSGAYGFSLDQLAKTLPESELGQQSGLSEELLAAYADYLSAMARFQSNGYALSEETYSALRNALHTLEGEMTVTGPVEETIPTKGLSQLYTAQIPTEALEACLIDCADILLEEEVVSAYCRLYYAIDGRSDVNPMAEIKAQWEESVRIISETFHEVDLIVYIQNGMALYTNLLFTTYDGGSFSLCLELGDGNRLTNAASLTVDAGDGDWVRLTHLGNLIPRNGLVESALNITLSDGWTQQDELNLLLQWDTNQTQDNLTLDGVAVNASTVFSLAGSVSLDGGVFLGPLGIRFTGEDGDEYSTTVSQRTAPTTEIKHLTAQATDILNMSADELDALMGEIEASLNRWLGFLP